MLNFIFGSIWPYAELIFLSKKKIIYLKMSYPTYKIEFYFSWNIISNKRSVILLRYLNHPVLMLISTTVTMRKIRCELLTCWLPIMFKKPTKKKTRIRREIYLQKLHYCIQQLTKLSCTIRYGLLVIFTRNIFVPKFYTFIFFIITESFTWQSIFLFT